MFSLSPPADVDSTVGDGGEDDDVLAFGGLVVLEICIQG